MTSILSAPHFHDEQAAYDFVEARIWPSGPVCVHCGGTERFGKLTGRSTRIGVYKCYDRKKPLTVKVGTIFESSNMRKNRPSTRTKDPAQSARFLETAKGLGIDESGASFDQAMNLVLPKAKGGKPDS